VFIFIFFLQQLGCAEKGEKKKKNLGFDFYGIGFWNE